MKRIGNTLRPDGGAGVGTKTGMFETLIWRQLQGRKKLSPPPTEMLAEKGKTPYKTQVTTLLSWNTRGDADALLMGLRWW